jgi:hypothetical protein
MFKPGDNVKCIDNESLKSSITINKIYIVEDCYIDNNRRFVTIKKDDTNSRFRGLFSCRFICVREERKQKLEKLNRNEFI